MSVEWIDELVEVRVDFYKNRVIPRVLHWGNKTYSIRSVNMVHSSRDGDIKYYFFSVSDTANYFKLRLDTDSLQWRLIEMYAE